MLESTTGRDADGFVTITLKHGPNLSIVVTTDQKGGGSICSNGIKEVCPFCGRQDCYAACDDIQELPTTDRDEACLDADARIPFNSAIDGMESLILAAACEGVDIGSSAFLKAIETTIEAIGNNFGE